MKMRREIRMRTIYKLLFLVDIQFFFHLHSVGSVETLLTFLGKKGLVKVTEKFSLKSEGNKVS